MSIIKTKTYLLVAVLSLVLLHAFSFGFVMGMETDKQGQMSPCPFMVASSKCTMNFSQHLSSWQSMFTATLDSNVEILAIVGFIILVLAITLKYLAVDQNKEFTAYKFYTHESSSSIPSKLIELFSRGILNPKIYALATF